jgi:hypothetical protein
LLKKIKNNNIFMVQSKEHSMEAIDRRVNNIRSQKPLRMSCAYCGNDRSPCEQHSIAKTP